MERKALILKDGKVQQLSSSDILLNSFSNKRLVDENLTINEKKQMIIAGDFKLFGTSELIILADGEFANIQG